MRIFFVCQRVPYPPNRGDKIATYNELRHLAASHEVHVFCLADGKEDLGNVPGALRVARQVTAVPVSNARAKLRAVWALATGQPLSVAMLHEPALHAAIRQQYSRLQPDLILVFSSNVAQYADPFGEVPRIMQFADLDSLKFASYAEQARPPMCWIYAIENRRLLAYEQSIAAKFSHSLVCTQAEERDFRRLIPGSPVSVVGNGVDLEFFRITGATKQPGEVVFTGVMNYAPNVDAVTWFAEAILPLVHKQVPNAHFTICGSSPTAAAQRLAQQTGIAVTGRVADIRPYLESAEVFVAPLRMARGIQNKVIEAMAMRLPVVASPAAWAGTGLPAGEGILPADTPEAFAAAVVRLLQDGTFRTAMAAQARDAMERRFSWDAQMARLDQVIAEVTARASPAQGQQRAAAQAD